MTLTTEEFANGFHSLSGTTIGERRRRFHDLLKTASDVDLNRIEPKTPLEENFKIQALIYFRRLPELIDVLKSENPIFIRRLLKTDSWFWQRGIFQHVNEEELVEEIFPCASFNTKVKVINKLALHVDDKKRGDKIFEAVKQKYNLYLAAKLLPCCSENVILTSLLSSRIEITPRQLLIIIKKYPDITESIFKALNQYRDKNCLTYKYKNVFKYLLNNDKLLFLKLHDVYKPSFRLGGRATEKFVQKNKRDVIDNGSTFYKLLHKKRINKSVHSDFEEFYLNMFPKSLNAFKSDVNFYINVMKHMPSHMSKINLMLKTFERSYGDDIWDHCVTPGLLELMSVDERKTWMENHSKPAEMSDVVWICLMRTSVSIPLLKKKIKEASDAKERAQLIGCMVETCRINDDRASLNEVCKYVLSQHRNDTSSLLICFLKNLKNCFDVDALADDHWKYMNEIIQLLMTRNEMPYYYNDWLQSYVNYRFEKDLPTKEILTKLSKRVHCVVGWHQGMKEKHQKKCLIVLGEILPEICKDDQSKHYVVQFLHDVVTWNEKHPKDEIPLIGYAHALSVFKQVAKGEDYVYRADAIIMYFLQSKLVDKTEKGQWLDLLFNKKNLYVATSNLDWLIKYETDLILNYLEPVTNTILYMWYTCVTPFFWRYSRNYTHLEIPQKIAQICSKIISSTEESDSVKKNAMTALSIILEPEEFLKIIVPYYPVESKMDVEKEDQEAYGMQQAITACLKHVIPPSIVLESISHFSKGDYLKYIQRALHSVSHNAAENNLISFYRGMIDRPVSVRKHAIYHTLKVLNWHEIKGMFETFGETEKNASILKVVFKGTFNYFVKNPNEYMWNLVKTNIKTVDVEDNEAWEVLMDIDKVPRQYLAQYLAFTFEIIETIRTVDNKLDEGKKKLIGAIAPDLIPQLPDEFCMGMIRKYFTKSDFQDVIFSFACMYVVYADVNLQSGRVNAIFNVLTEHGVAARHDSDGNRTKGRKLIYNFIRKFCSYFLDKKISSKSALVEFASLWNNSSKPHDAFDEYLYLEFTAIYVDFVNHKWDYSKLGDELGKISSSLFGLYGLSIVNLFGKSLNSFIEHFLTGTDDVLELNRLELIENIVAHKGNPHYLLVAVCLLSENVPSVPRVKLAYNRIISALECCDDSAVKFSLLGHYAALKAPTNENKYEKAVKYKSRRGMFTYIEEYSSKYKK